jgi:glycosyltransferase involved in cell wall biosynthesis
MTFEKKRVVVIVNAEWYFRLHWLPLLVRLKEKGNYEVTVITSDERGETEQIRKRGIKVVLLPFGRGSSNPLIEFSHLISILKIVFKIKPFIVHNLTITPVIYGTISGKLACVPHILNSITGLGYTFIQTGMFGKVLRKVITLCYRTIFRSGNVSVSLQNHDDRSYFVSDNIVSESQSSVILGVGVDTEKFTQTPIPSDRFRVIMATRMLWDKGVKEFVLAARNLKELHSNISMILIGIPDEGNPQAVPESVLNDWHKNKIIEWWGHHSDMPAALNKASIIALPSYREGLPTILIEAASVGRPIIATDVPGCREVVIDGQNGYLIPDRNHQMLTEKILHISENHQLMTEMGEKSREMAEKIFTIEKVYSQYWKLYNGLRLTNHK